MESDGFLNDSNSESNVRFEMVIIIAVILLGGCISSDQGDEDITKTPEPVVKQAEVPEPENNVSVKVYYFYHPRCPNCIAVEPLINYLLNNTEINFEMCNVEFFNNCSNMSKQLAFSVKKKTGFFGTPTAVVQENKNFRVFVGKYQVIEMVDYLRNYTYIPEIPLKDTEMPVEECLSCHEMRNIDPPSTMTCSYCCHGSV